MVQQPHGPLRSYGRIKSRPIKPQQAELLESLLPKLALDLGAPLDPARLMAGARETWLEIGFGGGEHLAEQAARHPDVLLLGAEPFLNGVGGALRHINLREVGNVRLHAGDARDLLARLPDAALAQVFILFPEPRLRGTARRADDWRAAPADHVPTRYQDKRLGDIAPVYLDFERIT